MAKKPAKARARTKHGPDAAQLKAVERLLEEENYKEAIRRVEPLVKRYPDHGGLRRALVGALEHGQGPRAAALTAFAWAERRPNSLPAQEALLYFANALHHLMLADRTAGKVRELGGETPGFPLDPALKVTMLVLPDGTRTRAEDLERFDIGKLHLEGEDFRGVVRWLAGLDLLPARNNQALALFHLNRIDGAYDAFLASWQADPDNLYALGWATRLRLYRGDDTGAQGLCSPLGAAMARRLDDALPQLDALLLLGEAVVLHNDGRPEEAEERLNAILKRVPDHPVALGNLAAARSMQGRGEEALCLLREVVEKHPDYLFARCNLARTLIEDGEIDAAERLLDGLMESDRLHIQEVFALYGALAMLYRAKGEEKAAQSLLSSLESMVDDEDDERRIAQLKRSFDRLDPVQRFRGLLESILKTGAGPAKRRR